MVEKEQTRLKKRNIIIEKNKVDLIAKEKHD